LNALLIAEDIELEIELVKALLAAFIGLAPVVGAL
jgi:hypothetical protein